MANATTVVMLIGAGVVPDVQRVLRALHELPTTNTASAALNLPDPGARAMSVRSAYFSKTEVVSAASAIGRVSADSVAAYPPGIPNLLPGEVITNETIEFLQATVAQPFGHVRGSVTPDLSAFRVVAN
jgi:lysine decarboxylase